MKTLLENDIKNESVKTVVNRHKLLDITCAQCNDGMAEVVKHIFNNLKLSDTQDTLIFEVTVSLWQHYNPRTT